jgi:hypothetical protein
MCNQNAKSISHCMSSFAWPKHRSDIIASRMFLPDFAASFLADEYGVRMDMKENAVGHFVFNECHTVVDYAVVSVKCSDSAKLHKV